MKLPEIPTDNLYKFMAISGIALIIVSFLPHLHSYKLNLTLASTEGEVETYKEKMSWIRADQNDLEIEIENLMKRAELAGITTSEITTAFSTGQLLSEVQKEKDVELDKNIKAIGEIGAKLKNYKKLLREHALTLIQIETNVQKAKHLRDMIIRELIVFTITGIFGVLLATAGFSLWYKKLQVPQDIIIKQKVKDEQKQ